MSSDTAPQQNARVLTQEEASNFRLFEKHRALFDTLVKGGVFDAPSICKIEINVHNGQIQNVYIHTQTYRREAGPR